MAINPCEDRQPDPDPADNDDGGGGGGNNNDNDNEVDETGSQPEVLPPEDPFAEAIPPASLPRTPEEIPPQVPQPEIQYVSATRDLTTIDENNFYQMGPQAILQIAQSGINASSIWLSQKTNEDVIRQVDRFRLALLNFWSFDGDSEIMASRVITDPRGIDRFEATPDPSRGLSIHDLVPISFRNDWGPMAPEDAQVNYFFQSDSSWPIYTTLENFPFIFNEEIFLMAQTGLPDRNTKASHFMDFYLKGDESDVWPLKPRGENYWRPGALSHQARLISWVREPEKVSFYKDGNIEFGKQFQDYVFDAPAAFFESEMNNILMSPSDSADIKVKAENQELHADIEIELQVPNVYQYYQAKQVTRLISDGRLLADDLPDEQVAYNQMLISNYEEIENDIDFETTSVLKFPSNKVETLEEINEVLRGSLTNYVEIGINTTQGGPINALLQRNRMDTIVMEFLTDDIEFNASREIERKLFTKVLDDQFISADGGENVNNTANDEAIQNIEEGVFVGLEEQISAVPANTGRNTDGYFWPREIMEYPLYYTGWNNQEMAKLEETIRSQIFINQMDQHIEEAKLERSFADILYGRKAYSEVIGYKVEKYRINKEEDGTETEEKIQEFLLMDNDSISRINLLDTQILPGRKYIYKIFTINFVIGTKYLYQEYPDSYSWAPGGAVEDIQNYQVGKSTFNIGVWSGRSISLIYAPFFEKTVAISDKPPLSPQVSFLPHHGIDNKHSVLLEANYGEIEEIPVAIYPEDEGLVEESSRAQNKRPGSKILYKSDSLPTEFEMIRIENQPESYRDFSHDMAVRRRVPATGKTGFFIVDLEPNKYYYYIFRAYDKGGLSNPTEVFRVRIVSYQNGIFMEMEPYEMYVKPKDFKLSFERMLKIRPSVDQRIINFDQVFEEIEVEHQEDESSLSRLRKELGLKGPADTKSFQNTAPTKEKVSIGNVRQEDKVWDKNFKIRIKSKTTGKKIDLNVTFSNKKTTIAAEE